MKRQRHLSKGCLLVFGDTRSESILGAWLGKIVFRRYTVFRSLLPSRLISCSNLFTVPKPKVGICSILDLKVLHVFIQTQKLRIESTKSAIDLVHQRFFWPLWKSKMSTCMSSFYQCISAIFVFLWALSAISLYSLTLLRSQRFPIAVYLDDLLLPEQLAKPLTVNVMLTVQS